MADDQVMGDPRALLQEAVKDADDDALVTLAENLGGIEGFLGMTFDGMKDALDTAKAQDAVIGWQIVHGDDVHPYTVTVSGGALEWERRDPEGARVTLRMKLPTFIRLIAGQLDGMQAFMSGQLQLVGDMIFAAQVQEMFAGAGTSGG